jgi:hypothetical protein
MTNIENVVSGIFNHPLKGMIVSRIEDYRVIIIDHFRDNVLLLVGALCIPKIYFVPQLLEKK